jgi:hypothetical protein
MHAFVVDALAIRSSDSERNMIASVPTFER